MKLEQLLNESVEVDKGRIVSKQYTDKTWPYSLRLPGMNLTTLEGCPSEIKGSFACNDNKLTSLEGYPTSIKGEFNCASNKLTSLKVCPETVFGDFICAHNLLTTLEGCPKNIHGDVSCTDNPMTSLEGIHKHIKSMNGILYAYDMDIKSHLLGLFLISGCKAVRLDNMKVHTIMNRHLPNGRDALIACQNELIEAGFEDYAQI